MAINEMERIFVSFTASQAVNETQKNMNSNTITLFRSDNYSSDDINDNATIPVSKRGDPFDPQWNPLQGCVVSPKDGKPHGRLCTYYMDNKLTDVLQMKELIQNAYVSEPENKKAMQVVVKKLCNELDFNGDVYDINFDEDNKSHHREVKCPTYYDAVHKTQVSMKTCPRWRREDNVGQRCRDLISYYFDGQNGTSNADDTKLEMGIEFCQKNKYNEDCACINRHLDPVYNDILSNHLAEFQTADHCWYKPCKDGSRLRDPRNVGDCNPTICSVLLNVQSNQKVSVHQNAIDCGFVPNSNSQITNDPTKPPPKVNVDDDPKAKNDTNVSIKSSMLWTVLLGGLAVVSLILLSSNKPSGSKSRKIIIVKKKKRANTEQSNYDTDDEDDVRNRNDSYYRFVKKARRSLHRRKGGVL